jgi:hypothetical protein
MVRVILYPRYRPTGPDLTFTSAELFLLAHAESLLATFLLSAPLLEPLRKKIAVSRTVETARDSFRTSVHWYGHELVTEIRPFRKYSESIKTPASNPPAFFGNRVATNTDIEMTISPTHCGTFYDDSSICSN